MLRHLADPEEICFVGGGWTPSTCDGLILEWPHRPGASVTRGSAEKQCDLSKPM